MTSSADDLRFLTEALSTLQDYLLSNELYWPLSGSLPRLTPGSLLLALKRMEVVQPLQAKKLQAQIDLVRGKWRTAWEKKIARETANRLRLWSQFLSDYANAPEQNADSYPSEARGRAILQLLLWEMPADAPEKSALPEMETLLKVKLHSGEFLWDADLQTAFPKTDFWFLYAKL